MLLRFPALAFGVENLPEHLRKSWRLVGAPPWAAAATPLQRRLRREGRQWEAPASPLQGEAAGPCASCEPQLVPHLSWSPGPVRRSGQFRATHNSFETFWHPKRAMLSLRAYSVHNIVHNIGGGGEGKHFGVRGHPPDTSREHYAWDSDDKLAGLVAPALETACFKILCVDYARVKGCYTEIGWRCRPGT